MALESFCGHVPDDRRYSVDYDMWVQTEGDSVVIGATAFGLHLAGKIIGFTAKPRGAEVERGRGLGTIECAKTVLAVRSPLSFVLLTINEDLEENPGPINRDAYLGGWMAKGRPTALTDEEVFLVDATQYRAHILRLDPAARIL